MGGYTGLWTAIFLKQEQPGADIVIIDQDCCGSGASGSNGGCILRLAAKFPTLVKFYGESEAVRLVKASQNAVAAIRDLTVEHRIECDLRIDWALYMAANQAQKGCMDPVIDSLSSRELNTWKKIPLNQARRFGGKNQIQEAFFSPIAGSVQPALLVRGMARTAREMGVRIFEHTPMVVLQESIPPKIQTLKARKTAKMVVLATNAWIASQFKEFARSIVLVSSDMVITGPCPENLARIGLNHGASICDSRTEPIKWTGALLVSNAVRRKEALEDAGKSPFWIDEYLSKFAKNAGKVDKRGE